MDYKQRSDEEWQKYLDNHPRLGRRVGNGHIIRLRDAGLSPSGERTWQEVILNDNGHITYGLYSPVLYS